MQYALVTGAGSGIGTFVARKLVEQGYTPILHGNTHFNELVDMAQEYGGMALKADLSDPNAVTALCDEILGQIPHVDILVNNAGKSLSGLFPSIGNSERRELFEINLFSAMEITRRMLPPMIARKTGAIVNIASIWGRVGSSCEVDYSVTKAALIGFTKALAKEVAPSGIRINAVAPGVIDTPMLACYDRVTLRDLASNTPLGRLGIPEDIANAVTFLCSPQAEFITGQVLTVDGGFL